MYYLLLCVAVVLFASQFLFNLKFQEEYGDTWFTALVFTIYTSFVSFAEMLPLGGFSVDISLFSVFMALVSAAVSISYTYVSIKAFSTVNLSAYSVFAMLGGMLLPFGYGIIFGNEPFTSIKCVVCILIAVSLFMTLTKGKSGGWIYYLLVFVLNGMSGVVSAIHQGNPNAVDSVAFMALSRLAAFAAGMLIWAFTSRKSLKINKKGLVYSVGFAVFCGFGNLLTLISLKHLPASVQYPIITGGVIVVSLFISIARKEKVTYKNVISAVLAFAASALMMFE